jgi:hypothetical protein
MEEKEGIIGGEAQSFEEKPNKIIALLCPISGSSKPVY